MEILYLGLVLLISLFCDYMIWQHFSDCFERQFNLTNQILSKQQFQEDEEMKDSLEEVLNGDSFDITGNEVIQHMDDEEE